MRDNSNRINQRLRMIRKQNLQSGAPEINSGICYHNMIWPTYGQMAVMLFFLSWSLLLILWLLFRRIQARCKDDHTHQSPD